TFPVAIGLVAYDGCLVLQNRSKRNSGSDFGKISLLANKLIEVDFLDQLTGEQTFQFWNDATIAWRNIDNSTSVSFKDISQQFIQLLGLNSWVIPTNVLLEASKQAMVRCLYSELNLNITKDR